MPDLKSAVRAYVDSQEPTDQGDLNGVYLRANRQRRNRIAVAGSTAAVFAVAAVVGGIAVSQPSNHAADVAASTGVPTHSASTRSTPDTRKPAVTIKLEGARTAPYSLPTLAQFTASGIVDRVAVGTVTDVDYFVSDDESHLVWTVMTVHTDDPLGLTKGQDITVRELGGVVPLRDVRSDFEAHLGTIPADRMDELVDFTDGTEHPVVGETELLFLQTLPAGDTAQYSSMARMTLDPTVNRFQWAGEAPNTAWTAGLTMKDVTANFAGLLGKS